MELSDIKYKEWNLQEIISDMASKILSIRNVYLFGSRGYRTNSFRSDIDLLIEFDGAAPIRELKLFLMDYPPIDVFINRCTAATSFVNDSEIPLRNNTYSNLFTQLDAIKLWDKQNGFEFKNKDYFIQKTVLNADFVPSSFEYIGSVGIIEDFILRESDITDMQKRYLREAVRDYHHRCYLSFISMMGTFYEDLLLSLTHKYYNRVQTIYPQLSNDYRSNVLNNSLSSKKRLEGLYDFVEDNDENYYKSNGFGGVSELYAAFDIIRKYRNEVDHPNPISETFDRSLCDLQINSFIRYVPAIYKIIKLLSA